MTPSRGSAPSPPLRRTDQVWRWPAIGTLVFGAVLGPEAPLIALGSVVGPALTSFVRLGPRETAVTATAGSFSAISAIFGEPLVAGLLLLEAGVGWERR